MPQPVIEVSSRELTYRNKRYHGINDVKEKDLICISCGNRIKIYPGKVFSHPVLNTLQCLQCHNKYDDINFISDDENLNKYCRLCGTNKGLYDCSTSGCPYAFCKKCIKRIDDEYLADAEVQDWYCFICEPTSLWKYRAICAIVIDSLPKKSKKKTYLHSEYLPSQKRKLAEAKRLQKSLQKLCDADEASSSTEVRPFFCSPSKVTEDKNDRHKKSNQTDHRDTGKSNSSNMSISSTSSSEDEVVDKMSWIKSKTKRKTRVPISSNSDSNPNDHVNKKKSLKTMNEEKGTKKSTKLSQNIEDSENSDDSAEIEKHKRKKRENLGKRSNNVDTDNRVRRLSLKSRNRPVDMRKSGSESNSSKDFQSTKLLRDSHFSKHLSNVKKTSVKINKAETSTKPKKEMCLISKQQSAYFKSKVLKIFDQLQEKCEDFKESVEDLKAKCHTKELADPDDADYIVLKSGTVINEITSFLDKKQKYLKAFYTAWSEDCQTHEGFRKTKVKCETSSSTSEEDESFSKKKSQIVESSAEETSNKKNEIEVSECDSDEIFSENEIPSTSKTNKEAKSLTEINEKSFSSEKSANTSMKDNHSRRSTENNIEIAHAPSPILGASKTKRFNAKHSSNEIDKEISKDDVRDSRLQSKSKKSEEIQEKVQKLDDKGEETQILKKTRKKSDESLTDFSDDNFEQLGVDIAVEPDCNSRIDSEKIDSTKKDFRKNVTNSERDNENVENNENDKNDENDEDNIIDDVSIHENENEISKCEEENMNDDETVIHNVKVTEKSSKIQKKAEKIDKKNSIEQLSKDETPAQEKPKEKLPETGFISVNCDNEFSRSINDLFESSSEAEPMEVETSTELEHDPLTNNDKVESAEKSSKDKSENQNAENKENNEDMSIKEEIDDEAETVIYCKKDVRKSKDIDESKQAEDTVIVISDPSSDTEEIAKQNLLLSDSDLSDDEINRTSYSPTVCNDNSTNAEQPETEKETRKNVSHAENPLSTDIPKKASTKDTTKDKKDKKNKKEKKRTTLKTSSNDELSDDDSETENAAKKALLNSSSDKQSTDSENTQAKKVLLMSSNSESSNSERSSKAQSVETNSSHSTLNLSVNSAPSVKRSGDNESDISVASRVKRRRINLNKNIHYMTDKKLRMICQIRLERLPQKVLDLHESALKSSMQYQRSKAIKSLTRLDDIERKRKARSSNSNSSDDDDTLLKLQRKKKRVVTAQDSLMDHLEKVKNGDLLESIEEASSNEDDENSKRKLCSTLANKDLMSHADQFAKDLLLNSASDVEQDSDNENDSTKDIKKKAANRKDDSEEKKEEKKEKENEDDSSDDEEKRKKARKGKWRRDKLLTMKLSDTDSEAELEKWNSSREKKAKQQEEKEGESSSDEDKTAKVKKRPRRRVLDSDSDIKFTDCDLDTDSSVLSEKSDKKKDKTRKRNKRTNNSSDTDSSTQKKSKPKRRRIKNVSSNSDSDKSENALESSQGTPGKSGRKNIRKVLKDKQVASDTKLAAKEEEERLKRIAERQKIYNEMYEQRLASEEKVESLVLDFDPETKKPLVSVNKNLVKRLKPHQAKGVKFMWDACFESLERIKTAKASGCILAHCMGLGKTLQVVTLVHTVLTHEATNVKTVMVVCPLSTVLNWVHEFHMWLEGVEDDDIEIYELTKLKKNYERKYQLQNWRRTGGVLVIGYDMFRTLTSPTKNMRTALKESVLECLVDPGPDVVVCDEGHILKNEDTALSKSMNRIKTLRRIVLTGTPLQNNLKEYHCMVQFVKPSLLGTKKEFLNRFVNPITNGQFDDSTEHDVKLMKKRAHVLHKMLEGSVQRFDYSVLTPFLPPKQEYVISLRLSEVQLQMYQYYLDNFARRHAGAGGSLFADFQELQRIWTHPMVVRWRSEKIDRDEKKRLSSDSEGSLRDFIDDDTTSVSDSENSGSDSVQSCHSNENTKVTKRRTRNNSVHEPTPEPQNNPSKWWSQFLKDEHFEDMTISSKLVMLFSILKASEEIGDKVLVFSQSLYSLSLIEEFLNQIDNHTQNGESVTILGGYKSSWTFGLDYFRLDGQTSSDNRKAWCDTFNKPSNVRGRLFLISTKAGGLGINLTAANRVIIFDASWNPSHDVQSIFRVYRFGQKKPCYVYRFLAAGTMEEKIYNRQVAKLSLSCRVVDEQQIERHYSNNDLIELYKLEPYMDDANKPTLMLPKDRLLANIFHEYGNIVESYHEHDSLLENKAEEELDEEERKQAWLEYEEEKKGKPVVPLPLIQPNFDDNMLLYQYMMNKDQPNLSGQTFIHNELEDLQQMIRKDFPNATPKQQQTMASRAIIDMYNYWEKQAMLQPRRAMYAPDLSHHQYAPVQPMQMQAQQPLQPQQQHQQQQQPHPHQQLQQLLQQQQPPRGNVLQGNAARGNVKKNDGSHEDVVIVVPSTSTATTQGSVQSSKDQEE